MIDLAHTSKPLGRKAYGSIGHLPGSRRGPADKGVNDGQCRICTVKPRDKHDTIIVQEKLDGSNVAIARVDGQIVPLIRAGYRAETSKYEQHHIFAKWVMRQYDKFDAMIDCDGDWVSGEWIAQAHGTRYEIGDRPPFAAFDWWHDGERVTYDDLIDRIAGVVPIVPLLFRGDGEAFSIERAMNKLGNRGFYDAIDQPEGAVWRVERGGKVDFLAKYVRPDKVDGKYLPELSGREAIWNWKAGGK